jgi:hypothetical protein
MIKVTEICFISGMGKCLAFQLTENCSARVCF